MKIQHAAVLEGFSRANKDMSRAAATYPIVEQATVVDEITICHINHCMPFLFSHSLNVRLWPITGKQIKGKEVEPICIDRLRMLGD